MPVSDTLEQEIRHLRALYWSDRDPEGRAFAPLADACLRAGRTDEAEELLQDGRSRLPEFLPGHLISARLHQAEGDFDRAEASYRAAHDLDPENSEVLLGLGRILAGRGLEEGVEMVERARALDPTVGRGDRAAVPGPGEALGPESAAGFRTPDPAGEATSEDRHDDIPAVTEFAPAGIEDFGSPWDFEDEAVISVSDLAPDEASSTGVEVEETPVEEGLDVEPPAPEVEAGSDGETEFGPPSDIEQPETPDEEEAGVPVSVETSVTEADRNHLLESADEDEDADPVVTTRTLAELFVQQGLTERAIEVYERLLARNPRDEGLRTRLAELGSEAPERSEDTVTGAVPDPDHMGTGPDIDRPDRHIEPDAPSFRGDVDTTDPEDTDPHVPSAPDPHPEDPTPFGWAATDEEPGETTVAGTSIAAYLGRLLAFTPGQGGVESAAKKDSGAAGADRESGAEDGEPLDDALFDSWEDRS